MNEFTPVSGTGTRYKFRNEKSGGGYEPNMYYMYSQPISPFLFLCDEAHDLLSLLLCVSSALVCFSLICSRGGEARQQQQWHLIPLPTRAGRWQMVWQCPRLGFLAETGRFVTLRDALSTIFLLAFVPCFLLVVFRFSFLYFFSCTAVCLSSSYPFVCAAISYSQIVRIL